MRHDRRLAAATHSLILLAAAVGLANPARSDEAAPAGPSSPAPAALEFRDFYRMPVGPEGLEPTPGFLALDGRRVQLTGYVVHEEEPEPGLLLLSPVPAALADIADGPADGLPVSTVYVRLPASVAGHYVVAQPGPWTVTGTLDLGGRPEAHGRYSYVRLQVSDASDVRGPEQQALALTETAPRTHAH